MFPGIVPKMHRRLTFLAIIQNEPSAHENPSGHLDSGAAHDRRGRLYRPALHQRSGHCSTGELSGPFSNRVILGTIAMLSVDQFLRLMCVPAVILALLVAAQISAAVNPSPAMARDSE